MFKELATNALAGIVLYASVGAFAVLVLGLTGSLGGVVAFLLGRKPAEKK